jgi:hypothetical protein
LLSASICKFQPPQEQLLARVYPIPFGIYSSSPCRFFHGLVTSYSCLRCSWHSGAANSNANNYSLVFVSLRNPYLGAVQSSIFNFYCKNSPSTVTGSHLRKLLRDQYMGTGLASPSCGDNDIFFVISRCIGANIITPSVHYQAPHTLDLSLSFQRDGCPDVSIALQITNESIFRTPR